MTTKTLVATDRTQGKRSNDYHWAINGELVFLGLTCDRDLRNPDNGGCGCGRGFAGLASHRATTTAVVAELPLTLDEYVAAMRDGLQQQGYPGDMAPDVAREMVWIARRWPPGAVVQRRLDVFTVRELGPPPAVPVGKQEPD